MASFRQTRESLLLAHNDGLIDDEEFALLFDINTSRNLDYPYWNYPAFDLDAQTDDECRTFFRFYRSDIYRFSETLDAPVYIAETICISL